MMSSIAQPDKSWTSCGPILRGGTAYSVAVSPVVEVQRCWAATGCGVFISEDQGETWIQSLSGFTTPLLAAIAVSPGGALVAGSLQGDLFTSYDYGESWRVGIVPEESRRTVVAVTFSPSFKEDASVYAATDGAGLLVSRNSGRIWEDSSFGLGDDTVLAVVTAPDWSKREVMFAATTEGVFVSQNGGRAWRETELMLTDDVVGALAISAQFETDRTIFAGTEQGKVYRSQDSGRTWDLMAEHIGDGPLNCLWVQPHSNAQTLVAGVASSLYVSQDGGATWVATGKYPGAVLALAGDETIVLAALQDEGVARSLDGGKTWSLADESLAARGFARLAAADDSLFVLGPQEGVAHSLDGGKTWQELSGLAKELPLATIFALTSDELFVAGQTSGILRSGDCGQSWETVCEATGVRVIDITPSGSGLAGTAEGDLFLTQDGGKSWSPTPTPVQGQEILAIAFSPQFENDHTILMGTAIPATPVQQARVALWRTTNAGANWRQVTTQVTTARWLEISLPLGVTQHAIDQAVMTTGPFCLRPLRRAKDVWISTRVDPTGTNALSVVLIGEIDLGGKLYVGTGNGVFRSLDGGRTWHAFLQPDEAQSFISLTAAYEQGENVIYALSLGGRVYRHVVR
ncbi:MAG: hypothetical protein GXY52_07945 [Chloroflexi bacterium]|nr:hypothetical protein [Chloroflexota bacterium]